MSNISIKELRHALREFSSGARGGIQEIYPSEGTKIVKKDVSVFVPSTAKWATRKLIIDGVVHNDGFMTIEEKLTVNGRLINHGEIEVGW